MNGLRGHEIIDYCNKSYLLDSLANDGSYATLKETELKIARIEEKNVIRYAGHGEENLSDLREKIEQLVKAEN